MSRCVEFWGKSSRGPQKQLAEEVTSAHAETRKPNDNAGEKTVTHKARRSLPARALPRSVPETQRSGFPSGEVLDTDDCSPKESINITPRVEEPTQLTAVPEEELNMEDLRKAEPSHSTPTGGATRSPPPAEQHGEEDQTEEEDVEDEDIQAPVELVMEFLRALMDRDFQLAIELCQMILFYEPDNPEASEFLPLIQKKLSDEQEAEQISEDDEEDDDDDDSDESGSDEESSQCSSSSSSSSPSDDEEEEKQVNRHKPCPPSHISP